MKFQRHLDGFREYLRAHHFAARTLETYGANTKRFLAFLEQRYPRIDTVEQVTKDTILDYQRHLAQHMRIPVNLSSDSGGTLPLPTRQASSRCWLEVVSLVLPRGVG